MIVAANLGKIFGLYGFLEDYFKKWCFLSDSLYFLGLFSAFFCMFAFPTVGCLLFGGGFLMITI
jgi:hypothetical protein